MKTLLIVDDSRVFRNVLERILSPYFKIIAKGQSGFDGLVLYQKLKPNLVLMDITMPNCSGKECLEKIIHHDPSANIVMVSSLGDEQTVSECITLGAKGYVTKDSISQNDGEDSSLVQTLLGVASKISEAA